MAARFKSADVTESHVTTCSICRGMFMEPKALPCLHTFCLQCLVSFCSTHCSSKKTKYCLSKKKKKQKPKAPCPLCNKSFKIPRGGIQNLPNKFFFNRLPSVTKSLSNIEAQKSCELCPYPNADIPSTSYCVDCQQNICDRCPKIRKKASVSESHLRYVSHVDLPSPEKRLNLVVSFCERHPSEENKLYCYGCKVVMCLRCSDKHSQHKTADVVETGELLRQQLGEDIIALSSRINRYQTCRERLELDTETFLKEVASTETEILEKYDHQLHAHVQSHKKDLTEELRLFREKILKKAATKKEDMEIQSMIAENFKVYCLEIWSKRTAYDVARTACDVHVRAQELVKAEDDPIFYTLSGAKITFKPSFSSIEMVTNFTGKLILSEEAGTMQVDQLREQTKGPNQTPFDLAEFVIRPTLLHVIPRTNEAISGITVLGKEVFLIRNTSIVYVYKSNDFSLIRDITITGTTHLRKIVGCSHYNCLYLKERCVALMHRYNLVSDIATNWSVDENSYGLSLSKWHNVLVTVASDLKRIQEYTTDGILVKEIILDGRLNNPGDFLQLSTGNIAICNRGGHRLVCIVDNAGRIVHSYGESRGMGPGRLNKPLTLTVDIEDNVLVLDCDANNNRVQLLSPTLTFLEDVTIPGHQLIYPCAMFFDARNRRLYIGEWKGGRLIVFDV